MENKYTPEEILELKKMIDLAELRGPFRAFRTFKDRSNLNYTAPDYEEPDNPLEVSVGLVDDNRFSVDVYKEPVYYLKYIIISTSSIATSNITQNLGFNPAFEDCVDWHDYLDIYDFVFHTEKEDIGLYINRVGLSIFVKWRLQIGK